MTKKIVLWIVALLCILTVVLWCLAPTEERAGKQVLDVKTVTGPDTSLSVSWEVNVITDSAARDGRIRLFASDKSLTEVFRWAKATALKYVGDSNDLVGPWYEAALPGRESFCMRDFSHQCIGAEILGLGIQNRNMAGRFAENISEAKDWCSYWEINRYNQPAPADYTNNSAFWYNLPANFDLVRACDRLYRWTGNRDYVRDTVFTRFFERSMNDYVVRWQLQPDSIMFRPEFMNLPEHFDRKNTHYTCRGLPTYVEGVPGLVAGADLIASLYSGCTAYAGMLQRDGQLRKAYRYTAKAEKYRQLLDSLWWDRKKQAYATLYTRKGKYLFGEGAPFLLWNGIIGQPERIRKTIESILAREWNVENRSYLPEILFRYGYNREAYDEMLSLASPDTERRGYPEVSYSIVEAIVCGLMGVEGNAPENEVVTCPHLPGESAWVQVQNIPVAGRKIDVLHRGNTSTVLTNHGAGPLTWRTCFSGMRPLIYIDGNPVMSNLSKDALGNKVSSVTVQVEGNTIMRASLEGPEKK